jgi:hypothetical protein
MHWTIKCAGFLLLLTPALALAPPAFAQDRDPTLSDSQEPGSVIVFPKFIRGTVTVDGVATPQTEIEYTVQCPTVLEDSCPLHMPVMVRFHWVCPGGANNICRETDFFIPSTVNEKVVLTPNGVPFPGVTSPGTGQLAPMAECPRGYLIGWVVNPTTLEPIRFDGLIGDAVLRVSGTAVAAYNAIPIQAAPGPQGGLITLVGGALRFDGLDNHYQAVTGAVLGDVKYIREVGTGGTFNDTFLTLLTLDVQSNRPNDRVFVDIEFFGGFGSRIGNENELSTSTSFICWQEFQLDTDIDENLNQDFMGRKGTFQSDTAVTGAGVPVTLLGLVEVDEGPAPEPLDRSYITSLSNDSVPIPTSFVPHN